MVLAIRRVGWEWICEEGCGCICKSKAVVKARSKQKHALETVNRFPLHPMYSRLRLTTYNLRLTTYNLNLPLLHCHAYAFDYGILGIFFGVIFTFKIYTEKASETLPESGPERTEERFENIVSALVCLSLDELHQHAGLVFCKTHQNGFILLENRRFHLLEIFLSFGLGRECFDVFICFKQSLAYELGIREGFFHIANGAPIEITLFLIFELEFGKHRYVVENQYKHGVAFLTDGVIFPAKHLLPSGAGIIDGVSEALLPNP